MRIFIILNWFYLIVYITWRHRYNFIYDKLTTIVSILFQSWFPYASLFSTLLFSSLLFSTLLYSSQLFSSLLYSSHLFSTLLISSLLISTLLLPLILQPHLKSVSPSLFLSLCISLSQSLSLILNLSPFLSSKRQGSTTSIRITVSCVGMEVTYFAATIVLLLITWNVPVWVACK